MLNFGISNYGVGQYLLAWERFASAFDPDYVVVLVGGYQLQRTVSRYEIGRFHHSSQRALWIRPTFRLQDGRLVREPAADYEAFITAQWELIAGEFGGSRIRRRETSVLGHLAKTLWTRQAAAGKPLAAPSDPGPAGRRGRRRGRCSPSTCGSWRSWTGRSRHEGGEWCSPTAARTSAPRAGASEALKRLCSEHADRIRPTRRPPARGEPDGPRDPLGPRRPLQRSRQPGIRRVALRVDGGSTSHDDGSRSATDGSLHALPELEQDPIRRVDADQPEPRVLEVEDDVDGDGDRRREADGVGPLRLLAARRP